MKERPILFSTPMVRATLKGRKTQTRLVVKDHHIDAAMSALMAALVLIGMAMGMQTEDE